MTIPPLWAITGAGALLLGFAGGWTVRDWKADSAALEALNDAQEREDKARRTAEAAATKYEGDRSNEQARTIERQSELRTIYRDRMVPVDCAVPDAARGLLDEARTRANARASGEPVGPVPGPSRAADAPE